MKISVVTVCRNAVDTIGSTLESVASQTHADVEHIVVDGASDDGTVDVIAANDKSVSMWLTEPDKGIYDAMNKGVAMATGDVIGFLNADDVYANNNVVADLVAAFERHDVDACFGDLVFVKDDMQTIVRYYHSHKFTPERLAKGWMPPHPALYLKKNLFDRYGLFKTDYEIAADYELVVRLFAKQRITYHYLPEVLVKMRVGGVSNRGIRSNWVLNREIVRSCRENGIDTNMFRVLLKFPLKLMELVKRPES